MAHPGEDVIRAQPAGRKRRYLGWDVCLQAQDKALVFCDWYAVDSSRADSFGNLFYTFVKCKHIRECHVK